LIYTVGDPDRFIDARSTKGFTLKGAGVGYTSKEFTGVLVDFSHGESESDSQFARILGCCLQGVTREGGVYVCTAKALVSFNLAIFSEVEDTSFYHAQAGVRGQEVSKESIGYSNVCRISNCLFEYMPVGIMNPGQSWTIEGNTFEGLQGDAPSPLLHAVADDISINLYSHSCLTIRDNWCGDGYGEQVWIRIHPGETSVIEGNEFSGGVGSIQFYNDTGKQIGAGGMSIRNNNCITKKGFGIDLTNGDNIVWTGLEVVGNNLSQLYESGALLNIPSEGQHRDISIHSNHTASEPPFTQPFFRPKTKALVSGALAMTGNLEHQGTKAGFYNTAPISKPTVTGAKGGNAALTSLVEQLAALGLIKNSTT